MVSDPNSETDPIRTVTGSATMVSGVICVSYRTVEKIKTMNLSIARKPVIPPDPEGKMQADKNPKLKMWINVYLGPKYC